MKKGNSYFLNTIDWYIIRKIIATFFVAIILISLVIIIIDLGTKLDDFIKNNAPIKSIFLDYYLNIIPRYANMFGHLFFFISVVFVTSKLTSNSETVAILCSGISFARLLRPFIACAVVVGILGLYLSNILIPSVNVKIYQFEQMYYKNKFVNNFIDIHIQTDNATQIYVHHFDNNNASGFMFTKETFDNERMKEKIYADMILFDSATQKWNMINYSVREVDGKNEQLTWGDRKEIDLTGLLPNDFNKILRIEQLNFNELNHAIERETVKGSSVVRDLRVEKYQRLFNPIAYIILTLIGVSLSCKKTRGGTGLNLALGIGLAFSLILLMKIFNSFAINGNLLPILASIIPLVIYTLIAILLLKNAPK